MPRIALEGKINGCQDAECVDWRKRVKWELGHLYSFHDPMDLDCRGREKEMEDELVLFDTGGIASSDILLVLAETPSWGTAMAIQMGWAQHKYIVSICPDVCVSPWLNNRSNIIVSTLDDAIKHLKERGLKDV